MTDGSEHDKQVQRLDSDRWALANTWAKYDASADYFTKDAVITREPHIITFANEKGGVGKSTSAFHTTVALCNAGESVAVIDLDFRQRSLAKAVENRVATARRLEIDLPCPVNDVMGDLSVGALESEIRRLSLTCNFIVIDVAGHDSEIGRFAISVADTLVTPINDSFVDLNLLGHVEPVEMQFEMLGPFARLVNHLVIDGRRGKLRPVDWIVVQNRLRSLSSHNERRFNKILSEIAPVAGFRIGHGLGERVIYRELYPFGLTLLDADFLPDLQRVRQVAKDELQDMLASLRLPHKVLA